jgi:putative addiction module killer protein
MADVRVVVYLDPEGRSPFTRWFEELNAEAAAKVTTALYRLGQGNFSNVEGVGGGVFEYRIDFGPCYRVYFGKDGETLVVLLGGSSKKRQQRAIQAAHQSWQDYKRRKAGGR